MTIPTQHRPRPANTGEYRHGCHNRPPLLDVVLVQEGLSFPRQISEASYVRDKVYVKVDNPMTKDCQYSRSAKVHQDPACKDCIHHQPNPDQP